MQSSSPGPVIDLRADVNRLVLHSNLINLEVIIDIEHELRKESGDLISLMFLLYDDPDIALVKLTAYQQSSNAYHEHSLLQDWLLKAKCKLTWKHELVEGLLICKMNNLIRKMGFDLNSLKTYYQTDNCIMSIHINPVKKLLYRICEEMNATNFSKFKRSLLAYGLDFTKQDICEIILLELISKEFIQTNFSNKCLSVANTSTQKMAVRDFVKTIETLEGLQILAMELNALETEVNKHFEKASNSSEDAPISEEAHKEDDKFDNAEIFEDSLNFENLTLEDFHASC